MSDQPLIVWPTQEQLEKYSENHNLAQQFKEDYLKSLQAIYIQIKEVQPTPVVLDTTWQKLYKMAFNQPTIEGDPDGPLVPLPDTKARNKAPYAAPAHDYIAMLYRPYVSPI